MSELMDRVVEIVCHPQLAGLSTVTEGGLPWVRYVMIEGQDDMTIRCATFINARKVAQIKKNPEVHLTCGVTDLNLRKPYLQIQAVAALTTDQAERAAFWNPGLAQIFKGPDDPSYGLLIILPYRIEYCSPASMNPEVWDVREKAETEAFLRGEQPMMPPLHID
ncbi:MAG: pyridoxamine 5'-phosphate oxidase family protein [Kiritimatiellales bacterium]|nr:pyridoxamine 5'-phosphate oxidase family protein [Kiritimatiellales bacterium]